MRITPVGLAFAIAVPASLLVLVASPFAGQSKPPKQDSEACLVRPDDGPEPTAKGTVRIRSDANGDRFDLRVQGLSTHVDMAAFIEDPPGSDTFEPLAPLSEVKKDLVLALDTKKGDALPLDVPDVADLIGRRVEIRNGSDAVVLFAEVPPFGLDSKPHKATVKIAAPPGSPFPDVTGTLSLRSKADKGQERIILKVKKLPPDAGPFNVFVEDGVGVLVDDGPLVLTGKNGTYKRDTKQGDQLPNGATSLTGLTGRALELRDHNAAVLLSTELPPLK